MKGRTIRLYLVDGTPTGILTAEIINWTGKIIVAPRTQLAELARRDEVRRTGIYCLIGADPDQPDQDRVYIGEGDNVLKRLLSHDKDESKDFWTRTAIVISKDDNITKSHGRYLESRFITLAMQAGRAAVVNGTNPEATLLPEPDVADMEYFLAQVQMTFPVLGMTFLQPKVVVDRTRPPGESPRFVMKEGEKQATAIESGDEFIVLAGSPARKAGVPSWMSYRGRRDALVASGKLIDSDDPAYYTFAEDVSFASPSAAAAVVAAGNRNGRTYWRVEGTNQTYAEWHDAQLPDADSVEPPVGAA